MLMLKSLLVGFSLFFCSLSIAETVSCENFPCAVGQKAAYLRSCNCCACVGNFPIAFE
jgi:hypothetical protein